MHAKPWKNYSMASTTNALGTDSTLESIMTVELTHSDGSPAYGQNLATPINVKKDHSGIRNITQRWHYYHFFIQQTGESYFCQKYSRQ